MWPWGGCGCWGARPPDWTASAVGGGSGGSRADTSPLLSGTMVTPHEESSGLVSHVISVGSVWTIRQMISAGTPRRPALRAMSVVAAWALTVSSPASPALWTPINALGCT